MFPWALMVAESCAGFPILEFPAKRVFAKVALTPHIAPLPASAERSNSGERFQLLQVTWSMCCLAQFLGTLALFDVAFTTAGVGMLGQILRGSVLCQWPQFTGTSPCPFQFWLEHSGFSRTLPGPGNRCPPGQDALFQPGSSKFDALPGFAVTGGRPSMEVLRFSFSKIAQKTLKVRLTTDEAI
jgi:hypothetical protein